MSIPILERLFTRTNRPSFLARLDVVQLLGCVLIILLHLILLSTRHLERVEYTVLDHFFRQRPPLAVHEDLVLIEIDEESLQSIGRWPWPLHYHATMIQLLHEWGAKAIIFDFVLKESSASVETKELEAVLQTTSNVYLPVYLEAKPEKTYWVHSLPMVLDPHGEQKQWEHSTGQIERYAKALGHTNAQTDPDGVLRRTAPYLAAQDQRFPYLGLEVARDVLKQQDGTQPPLVLPLDEQGKLLINWAGRWEKMFPRYAYANLVRSFQATQLGRQPMIDPAQLKNKICLIGTTAHGVATTKVTPFGVETPMVASSINVLNSLLRGEFLGAAALGVNAIVLAVIGVLAAILFLIFRALTGFLLGLGLAAGWLLLAFFLFWQRGFWFYGFQPVLLILSLFIFSTLYGHFMASRERARLFDLATRDGLTGLFVIRYFREVLNQVVREAHANKRPLSVILIDIDNFKPVNDTHGHVAGDYVLKQAAKLISSCLRLHRPFHQADLIARYGGEEFIIMLQDTDLQYAATKAAERVRSLIAQTEFIWEGKVIPVTISLGVGTLHEDESVPDSMVRRADEALYAAKRTGKNKVCTEETHAS